MRKKAIILIALGVLGAIFISTFDIIMGKPVNDLTGPKSIIGFIICGIFILKGVLALFSKKP